NGDNLLAIHGSELATAIAVEAIRLVDHYHFPDAMERATKNNPLTLQVASPKGEHPWRKPYYDDRDLKSLKREVFIRPSPGKGAVTPTQGRLGTSGSNLVKWAAQDFVPPRSSLFRRVPPIAARLRQPDGNSAQSSLKNDPKILKQWKPTLS